MPLYEYENKKTGERFTEHLPIHKRDFPCRNHNIRRVITAPNLSIISDMGGKEDKARKQIIAEDVNHVEMNAIVVMVAHAVVDNANANVVNMKLNLKYDGKSYNAISRITNGSWGMDTYKNF